MDYLHKCSILGERGHDLHHPESSQGYVRMTAVFVSRGRVVNVGRGSYNIGSNIKSRSPRSVVQKCILFKLLCCLSWFPRKKSAQQALLS